MKKFLLLCLIPLFSVSSQRYSWVEQKYFSVPATEEINQEEYHELVCILNVMLTELANCSFSRAQRQYYANSYLVKLNTPESNRLLADLIELQQ